MNVTTIYDFSGASFHPSPAYAAALIGAVFLLIAAVECLLPNLGFSGRYHRPRAFIGAFAGTALLVFAGYYYVRSRHAYDHLNDMYLHERCPTVYGTVADLHREAKGGHGPLESFRVGDVRFRYSWFSVQLGYHTTVAHGSPIREGLPVKITYCTVDDRHRIVRLQVQERP